MAAGAPGGGCSTGSVYCERGAVVAAPALQSSIETAILLSSLKVKNFLGFKSWPKGDT